MLAESAPSEEMQVLLQGLIEKNRALQRQLDSRGSSATDTPKPEVAVSKPSPATTRAAEKETVPAGTESDNDDDCDEEAEEGDDAEEDDEEDGEQDDEQAEKSSAVTPPPKAHMEKPTPPAPEPEFANANSSSHRAEWMAFGRRLEAPDAATKFPEIVSVWSSSRDVPRLQTRFVHKYTCTT